MAWQQEEYFLIKNNNQELSALVRHGLPLMFLNIEWDEE